MEMAMQANVQNILEFVYSFRAKEASYYRASKLQNQTINSIPIWPSAQSWLESEWVSDSSKTADSNTDCSPESPINK